MKSIAIVTDSNCGMSPTQVKDLGIYMLPMPFFIDDKEYLEDIDMNQSEFFQHLYHCSYSEVPETGRPHHSCSCSPRNHAPSETGSADPGRKAGRLLQGPHHDPGKKHYD